MNLNLKYDVYAFLLKVLSSLSDWLAAKCINILRDMVYSRF